MDIKQTTEVWEYDGTFYGFLTIVYHAFKEKLFPEIILTPETTVETLFSGKWIERNNQLAEKIHTRLINRLNRESRQFIFDGFYCSLKEKDRCLLDAIQIALQTNDSLTNHLGHPSILALQKSLNSLFGEVHLFTGFIRFEAIGKLLYSKIAPKHFSLPFLCPHFAERFPNETLLIYDENHRLLGIIQQGKISFIEDSDPPSFDPIKDEEMIQEQWKLFLEAVTIDERRNEQVQRNHLPKRYRGNMIEFD